MFRLIAVPALIAVSAAALLTPTNAFADDRYYGDRDRGYSNGYSGDRHAEHEFRERRRHWEHEWREHERREHEWREREGRRHRDRDRDRNGYYDQFGYWRPYR